MQSPTRLSTTEKDTLSQIGGQSKTSNTMLSILSDKFHKTANTITESIANNVHSFYNDESKSLQVCTIRKKEWHVRLTSSKKRMVNGHFLPTMTMGMKKRRRLLCVELQRKMKSGRRVPQAQLTDSALSPSKPLIASVRCGYGSIQDNDNAVRDDWTNVLQEGDVLMFKVLKKNSTTIPTNVATKRGSRLLGAFRSSILSRVSSNDDDDSVAASVSTLGTGGAEDATTNGSGSTPGWTEYFQIPFSNVTLAKRDKNKCVALIGKGASKKERDIFFDSDQDAIEFFDFVNNLTFLMENLAHETFRSHMISVSQRKSLVGSGIQIDLLVEIVSAMDLRNADIGKSDPYCVVLSGDEVLHRTSVIYNTLEPIWTLETGSLFLISKSTENFFLNSTGIIFQVRDYDNVKLGSCLGQVIVSQQQMLHAKGERMELKLVQSKAKHKQQGTLVIRCRRATPQDIDFMKRLKSKKPFSFMKTDHQYAVNHSEFISPLLASKYNSLSRLQKRSSNGEKLYRVRPCPDPDSSVDTQWMTKMEIEETAFKPSRNWIEAGFGDLGFVFLEVIGCDNLPNKDAGINLNNKTDAFVTAIFEDAVVSTEVVNDCLSPRFLPWSRRAFMFRLAHSSSPLILGVHDHDKGIVDNHDPIGRATIDLCNLAPNTEYLLHYTLYNSAQVKARTAHGTIIVRIVIEMPDQRKIFLDALSQPERFHVYLQKKKDFHVARYTVLGDVDVHRYSLETLISQLQELLDYGFVVLNIQDALKTVLLWRCHCKIYLTRSFGIGLPLHSIIAFIGGISIIERPHLTPTFFLASIAWFLLALLEHRHRRPSPWNQPPSYPVMMYSFLAGRTEPLNISPEERHEEDAKYIEYWTERRKATQVKFFKLWKEQLEEWEVMVELGMETMQTDSLTTQVGPVFSFSPNLFKSYLYPWQLQFEVICNLMRFVSCVLKWEYYYLSFWITTAAILLATFSLFIPFQQVSIWTGRMLIWVFLGPWMKILDICYFRKQESLTEIEIEEQEVERLRRKRQVFKREMQRVQILKENAQKLISMAKHIFGNFIVSMPHLLKLDRYHDMPLPQSSAKPLPRQKKMSSEVRRLTKSVVMGQRLVGDMIPLNAHGYFVDKDGSKSDDDAIVETKCDLRDNLKSYGHTKLS